MSRFNASTAVLSLIALAGTAIGQCGAIKMTAVSPVDNERVGGPMVYGLSSGNSRLISGSPTAQYAGWFDVGNVKIFAKISNTWGELAELNFPGQAYNGIKFGSSVGYNGAQIIVGAPGVQTDRGSAYIYEFQGAWTVVATIGNSQVGQRVGEAVAIDGQFAFVGAPGTDFSNNTDAGLVSVQKRQANGTWSQVQTISENSFGGFESNREMGAALAAQDGLLVIGSPSDTDTGWPAFHGSVRAMRRNASDVYVDESYLFSPAPRQAGANFGAAVATDGQRIAVSAPHASTVQNLDGSAVNDCGAVVIMHQMNGQWTTMDRVVSPTPTTLGRFGSSLALRGDRLIVGEAGTKKAYAFRQVNGQWALERSYSDEDASAGGQFGSGVALSDANVFIGDTGDDHTTKSDAGAVYIEALPAGWSDSCEAAPALAGTQITGCLAEATPDGLASPCLGRSVSQMGKSAWVSWTPTCSGNVIVDTIGSNFDTMLTVHSACPTASAFSAVACDDDGFASNGASILTFNAAAGTTYLMQVAGYNTSSGSFTLRVNEWQTPTNDTCASAQAATLGATAFKNCKATVTGPTESICSGTISQMVNDVWFKYTAPAAPGVLTVTTCGSSFDTVMLAYAGGTCPTVNNTAIACSDDAAPAGCRTDASRVVLNTTSGAQYLLRVGGFAATQPTGDGFLNLAFKPTCKIDFDLNGVVNIDDIFTFLSSWFAQDPRCDFDEQGTLNIDDIFIFLSAWFAGC